MLGVTNPLFAIDKILRVEESQNTNEIESALETLGLIDATTQGARLLFTYSSNVAKHVVELSFERQGRGKQLAALHAFGSICGVDRQEGQMKLDDQAEECLKRLVYIVASYSPKLTPSALLLSVLQQDPDVRIAAYRVLSGLVVREWCLREVCLKLEIIRVVTDRTMETTNLAWKHGTLVAWKSTRPCHHRTFSMNPVFLISLGSLMTRLEGVHLSDRKRVEAQPVV